MPIQGDSGTHASLLARLARSGVRDETAWSEFVERYGPRVYHWCRQWELQEADARDVTQTVLATLVVRMRSFKYDPSGSFRAWLKTVTRHAWQDSITSQRKVVRGSGNSWILEQLDQIEAREDLAARIEASFDLELLEQAIVLVRLRVAPHTWEAYRLTALDGLTAQEAASRLEMKVARVYSARNTVQRKLKEECQRLEGAQMTEDIGHQHGLE